MKTKSQINITNLKGKKLYNHINMLELETIKKLIQSIKGFTNHHHSTLNMII